MIINLQLLKVKNCKIKLNYTLSRKDDLNHFFLNFYVIFSNYFKI